METFNVLDELLMKKFQVECVAAQLQSLPSIYNRLRADRNLLFDNVYWHIMNKNFVVTSSLVNGDREENWTVDSTLIYQHQCGSKGGRYRISKKGTCYKCKKMIGSYKKLDTIRGLKALTSKEESPTYLTNSSEFTLVGASLNDEVVVNIGYAKH